MVDYIVSRSFSLHHFLLHITNLDQFLCFTNKSMAVSFEDIISDSAFDIMKLGYRDLKLGNVLRVFFVRKPLLC